MRFSTGQWLNGGVVLLVLIGLGAWLSRYIQSSPAEAANANGQTAQEAVAPASAEPASAPAAKTDAPVLHQEALDLRAALAAFPASFLRAVEAQDEALATELMTSKMLAALSPFDPAAFAQLQPLMEQEQDDFLWTSRPLVVTYWNGCVASGERCDQAALLASVRRLEKEAPAMMTSCLESLAHFVPLSMHAAAINAAAVAAAKSDVLRCLRAAASDGELDDAVVTGQLQSFLYFTRRSGDKAAEQQVWEELNAAVPGLPQVALP